MQSSWGFGSRTGDGPLETSSSDASAPALSTNLQITPGAGVLGRDSSLLTSEGTLYPLLARLRKQGWVETSRQASELGPPRRYYTLTADGAAALEAFTAAWGPFSRSVTTVLEDSR